MARASGVSRRAIRVGISELRQKPKAPQADQARSRRKGGGRKRTQTKDPTLLSDLEKLVDPFTRGDPESALRWTCKSVRKLADELRRQGHTVSHTLVAELLDSQDYSLQANRKTKEGASHPDRNAQFEYINAKVQEFLRQAQPAISVDTKKKEQVGITRTGVGSGSPRENRKRCESTILGSRRMCPTGSMIWGRTWVGSMSARTMIPPPSPSKASGSGGTAWGALATPTPANC